jgi:hypothetical protein
LIAITGHIRNGIGAATQTLSHQLPYIAKEFPEVAACHRGSINLELEVPLLVLVPDHRTKPIAWLPGNPNTETFDFVRIELEAPYDAPAVPAWLYIPHRSPHRRTLHIHEVITTQLNLAGVKLCRIKINRPTFQLPLPLFPLVVVV